MKPLATRWIDAPDTKRFAVPFEDLIDGDAPFPPPVEAIRLLTSRLDPPLRDAGFEPRFGKIASGAAGSEAGLYFDGGLAEGAIISLACPPASGEIHITIGRSSPLMRGAVWGGLALGGIAGFGVPALLLEDADFRLLLMSGLLFGLMVCVSMLYLAVRLPLLAGGASGELAKGLHRVVRDTMKAGPPARNRLRRNRARGS